MAAQNDIRIEQTGKQAKIRNPWLVLLFCVITFGIYAIFLWYYINRELADLGRSRRTKDLGDSPGLSVVAVTIGGIVYIPFIWTTAATTLRVQRAQRMTVGKSLNGWLAAFLWIFGWYGGLVYLQYELNKVWRAPGMRPLEPADPSALAAGDEARSGKLDELEKAGALTADEAGAERHRLGLDAAAG